MDSGATLPLPPLEEIYRCHASVVFRLVSRLLGPGATEADVDDMVQEVFITIDRARHGYRQEGSHFAFVYGVTTRVVMRQLRGRRRYRAMLDRFESQRVESTTVPPDPEETAVQREQVRRLWSALMRIPPERRVPLLLYRVEGLSAREVADALGLGEEAVRSRIRRAQRELERQLGGRRA
ncbi:MAG: RNA polymerase sigma factor [Deltaproteobacteria bacterium]